MLNRTGFRQQLVLTFTVGIAVLAIASSLVTTTLVSQDVRTNIISQGQQATQNFAVQSTLALLYQSPDNALEAVETTLAFPDVRAVAIYDLEHNPLLLEGETKLLGRHDNKWPSTLEIERETENFWFFVAPVYAGQSQDDEMFPFEQHSSVRSELLGHVRVAIGKQTLIAMTDKIQRSTFLVSALLASLLLLLLMAITSRVTTPLKNLAEIMYRAEQGEKTLRAEVKGPRDIIHMETAFNTMMDVLEARERELESARDAALEAARVKGEFAANVSHELRTPLNGILGMLELLFSMDLTPKQLEYAKIARSSGETLLELIDDILDFSRAKAGKLKPNPIDFYLHETMEDVIGLLSGQAARKKIDLSYHIEEQVPHALRSEAGFIRQLLLNLTGNAVKYTEQGSIKLSANISQNANGMMLEFKISDTGIGVPEESINTIFDAFSQVDTSTTRKFGGTGLGLAICHQLVEMMGGEIGVSSQLGEGSTFWFNVPAEPARGLPTRSRRQQASDLSHLRILVIDSEEDNRVAINSALKSGEINHHTVEDGSTGLGELLSAASEERPYEIAIVDEQLSDMKGIEFLRQTLAESSIAKTKVIIVASRLYGRNEARLAGIAGCIVKPLDEPTLLKSINDAISGSESRSELSEPVEQPASTAALLGLRVLIAEDNRANQKVAVGMLERLGCYPEVVFNGREALHAITEGDCEIVLMDCHMPDMDGYEATVQIRALESERAEIPIIAMTANTQEGDEERCIETGMSDYLPKPLKLKSLREKLLHWLSSATHAPPPSSAEFTRDIEAASEGNIDKDVLSELRFSIGQSMNQVIQAFIEDMPVYLDSLEKGISSGDAQLTAEFAHTIKGSSRNFGANRMSDLSQRIEQQGRSGNLDGTRELLDELGNAWEHVRLVLEHEKSIEVELEEQSAMDTTPPRILIVDDDRGMRFALRNVLEEDGYSIDEATNGAQAVTFCERQMPDLVLLDAIMPVMDGFRACSNIHKLPNGADTPVLIITSLDDEQSIGRAFAVGAVDYIPKPVHFAVLRQRVARLLHAGKAEKHIRRLAYHDTLTGLPNRAHFNGRLEEIISTRQESPNEKTAVLFLDLDRFKLVNDSLGHDVGDMLLKAVAERIQGTVRAGDLVARLGGDEFTVILERVTSTDVVAKISDKICRILAAPFVFSGQEIYVAASIGIAIFPTDGQDTQTIIKYADTAMFQAKEQGGGYVFYQGGMEQAASQIFGLEIELRQALERNELVLFYQPQAELASGRIVGAEALIRWHHPERGLISPGEFIPQAEESSLIINIGDWVMQEACRQIKAWEDLGLSVPRISVNLSRRHLEVQDIVGQITTLLKQWSLPANTLELEITESAIMRQAEDMISVLHNLKEMGLSLAIDDFGIGYSSLNYLKRFPIDRLKIDRSFVRDITVDPEDAAIINAIIALARSLRLEVVAEGVENESQQGFLRDHGCDIIQGYYLGKPIAANEFAKQYLTADRNTLDTTSESS